MIRLVKRDLKINAGEKHILEAISPHAYQAFQVCKPMPPEMPFRQAPASAIPCCDHLHSYLPHCSCRATFAK
jgi:hypothetical protein